MKLARLCLLVFVVPTLTGCGPLIRLATETTLRKLGARSAGEGPDTAYVVTLKPLNSGEGLVVYEPQSTQSSARWTSLGAGCSRYLQVHVAGQGVLGKTPLWGTVDDIDRRLKYRSPRLDFEQAREAARLAGATRIAIGQLSGNDALLTLTYQLSNVNGKMIATLKCSAPPAQMPAQLPLLARQMSVKLGITRPHVPSRTTLSSADLAFLGALKWKYQYGENISPADEARLKTLAPKDALSGLLAQRDCSFDEKSWQALADGLLKIAPDNALVAGEIGWLGAHRWMSHTAQLNALNKKYPDNYLLCTSRMKFERGNKARTAELKWAEAAVRSSICNTLGWMELAWTQYYISNDIRRSRYAGQISSAEWRQLNAIYAKAQAVALRATQFDPDNAYAWSQLSRTATFNGDSATAQKALWKSLALDPGNKDSYDWGFQLTQPKWGGNAASVLKIAQMAAANADKVYIDAETISNAFSATNQRPALRGIVQTIIVKAPTNASALTELAMLDHYDDRKYATAEPIYRRALKCDPNNAHANSGLGDLMFFVHHDAKAAETLYRKAIAEDSGDGYFHANLARCLAMTGRKTEGIAEANQAKSLGFSDRTHPVWSATGVNP